MTHLILDSVADLLAPPTLSYVAGHAITSVERRALTPPFAKSGSHISAITTNAGAGPRFVLKQVNVAWDWLMRATDDHACRSVTLWSTGLLDRLPASLDAAVVACCRDDDGWAILMHDVAEQLYVNKPFGVAANQRFLRAMAELHVAFWDDPQVHEPGLGLCHLEHVYSMFGPRIGQREANGPAELPRLILEGWELVANEVPPDVADLTLSLLHDLRPLCTALQRYPATLVHGDWRHANQGLAPDGRVILLDWQLAAVAPPAVELGRYLGANAALLPDTKEASLAYYTAQLADLLGNRFATTWWEAQLALGLLGGFVQDGWAMALKATHWHVGADARDLWRADLQWWTERVRRGMAYLG